MAEIGNGIRTISWSLEYLVGRIYGEVRMDLSFSRFYRTIGKIRRSDTEIDFFFELLYAAS